MSETVIGERFILTRSKESVSNQRLSLSIEYSDFRFTRGDQIRIVFITREIRGCGCRAIWVDTGNCGKVVHSFWSECSEHGGSNV